MQKIAKTTPDPLLTAVFVVITIIQFAIKAIAIWRASQMKQKNWFIVLFILIPFNDFGAVEIVYLFWFAKKRLTFNEIKGWFRRNS